MEKNTHTHTKTPTHIQKHLPVSSSKYNGFSDIIINEGVSAPSKMVNKVLYRKTDRQTDPSLTWLAI